MTVSVSSREAVVVKWTRMNALFHWIKTIRLFLGLLGDKRVQSWRKIAFVVVGLCIAVIGVDGLFDAVYALIPIADLASPLVDPLEAIVEAVGVLPLLLAFFPQDVRHDRIRQAKERTR